MTSGRSSGMKVSQSLMFSISRPEDQIDLNIGGTQTRDHKPTNQISTNSKTVMYILD